jgi:WD40 repeat protein
MKNGTLINLSFMEKCKFCTLKSIWKCDCSSLFFCQKHLEKHLTNDKKHLLIPVRNYLSIENRSKLKEEILKRESTLDKLSSEIKSKTSCLISRLTSLQDKALSKIELLKSSYPYLLDQEEYSDEDSERVESLLTSTLSYSLPETLNFGEDIESFYSIPLYQEKLRLGPTIEDSLKFLNENWGLILTSHTKEVNSVNLNPEKTLSLSTSDDCSVRIWDIPERKQKSCIKSNEKANCAIFSHDSKTIIIGSENSQLKLYDLESSTILNTLKGHSKPVKCLALTEDDKFLFSGSSDQSIRVWSLISSECLKVLEGHSEAVNSLLVLNFDQHLASGSLDNSIKLWKLSSLSLEKTLTGHSKQINTLTKNFESSTLFSCSNDKSIKLWPIFKNSKTSPSEMTGHSDSVLCIVLICADKKLVSSSSDHSLKVWKVKTLECEQNIETQAVLWSLACVSGNLILSGGDDSRVALWNLAEENFECFPGHRKVITKVEAAKENQMIISKAKDLTVRIWNLRTGKEEKVFLEKIEMEEVVETLPEIKGFLE